MVYGSRFRGNPGYKVPLGRRLGNLIFSIVLHRDHPQADHRPDLGFSDDQPPRDRALRSRLPARLPRGRGAADAPCPPPADPRGSGADERPGFGRSSIDYPRSAYYMAKVLLALFVGLFRRRPTAIEATGEDEPGVEPPATGTHPVVGCEAARCGLMLALVSAAPRVGGHTARDEHEESRPRVARRHDPRGGARRHDRRPAPGDYPLTHGDTLLAQHNVIRGAGVKVDHHRPPAAARRSAPRTSKTRPSRRRRTRRPRATTGSRPRPRSSP